MISYYIKKSQWYINHFAINHPEDEQAKKDLLLFKKLLKEEEEAERESTREYYDRLQEARNYDPGI